MSRKGFLCNNENCILSVPVTPKLEENENFSSKYSGKSTAELKHVEYSEKVVGAQNFAQKYLHVSVTSH